MSRLGLFAIAIGIAMLIVPGAAMMADGQASTIDSAGLSAAPYAIHARIDIRSDAALDSAGFPGYGTEADPYRIENYRIDSTDSYSCIYLAFTTKFVRISNCYLSNATYGIMDTYISAGQVELNGASNVTITNCLIDSVASGTDGIYIYNSRDVRVQDCLIECYLAGVFEASSSRVSVTGCTIEGNNRGVECEGGSSITVSSSTFLGANLGFYAVSGTSDILVDGCTFLNGDYAVMVGEITRLTVSNNIVSDQACAFFLSTSNNISVEHNSIDSITSYCIYNTDITDLYVANNTICSVGHGDYQTSPVFLDNVKRAMVYNNTIDHSYAQGIDLTSSTSIIIDCNVMTNISNVGVRFGYYPCENVIISNNTISKVSTGIDVEHQSSYVLIENNLIKDVENTGIVSWDGAHVLITGNTVSNTSSGFFLSDGNNVTIKHNQFLDHRDYPFRTQSEVNYFIYLNAFVGTGFGSQVLILGETSLDNGTYGNYWSWTANVDANTDGIADSPVSVPRAGGGYILDNYPLTGWAAPCANLAADNSSNRMLLSWSAVNYTIAPSGVDHYLLYRTWDEDSLAWLLHSTEFIDTTANYFVPYAYTVVAMTAWGDGPYCPVVRTELESAPIVTITDPSPDQLFIDTNSVTVSWTASDAYSAIDHAQVRLDDGGWSIASSTSYEFNSLSDGFHTVKVRVYNIGGIYTDASITFRVDLNGPVVTIGTPEEGAYVNTTTVHFALTAFDEGSAVDLDSIVYALDDGPEAPMTGLTLDLLVTPGEHTIYFKTADENGHTSSDARTFVVDTSGPELTITSPEDDSATNHPSLAVYWTATDDQSGIIYSEVRVDGGDWIDCGEVAYYTFTGLSEGVRQIEVRSWNGAHLSSVATISITIDLTQPVLNVDTPAADQVFDTTDVTVSWSGSDAGTEVVGYIFKLDNGEFEDLGLGTTYELYGLTDGQHTICVVAIDAVNNEMIRYVSFFIDTLPPTIDFSFLTEGMYLNYSTGCAAVFGTDAGSGGRLEFQLSVDDGPWSAAAPVSGLDFGPLSEGTHNLKARAVDLSGHTAIAEVNVTVDTIAPSLSIDWPSSGSLVNVSDVPVRWSAEDSGSGLTGYQYRIVAAAWSALSTVDSHTFQLPDATLIIEVRAFDRANNMVTASITFTVDATAPTVTGKTPTGTEVSPSENVTVIFSEAMNETTVAVVCGSVTGSLTWDGNTLRLNPTSDLLPGATYEVSVSGKDLAGNQVNYAWSFTVTTNGTITGVVLDEKGNPVAGATVSLENGINTTTGADGSYTLAAEMGEHNLTISRAGYQDQTVPVTVASGETSSVTDATLKATPVQGIGMEIILPIVAVVAIAIVAAFLILRKKRT